MSRSPRDYLLHILDETAYIIDCAQGMEKSAFLQNGTLKRAFVRSLEIIGEATKNLPDDFKSQYPQIAWRRMAGMRDKLIHAYFGVDYDVVWDVVEHEIPTLNQEVQNILKSYR
ncbi:MAG: DUF86 domain-containing protein [Elainellaceae cyanobacterium]